jgi:hypothetical protein
VSEVAAEWGGSYCVSLILSAERIVLYSLIHSRDRGQICARLLWLCIRGKCAFFGLVLLACVCMRV